MASTVQSTAVVANHFVVTLLHPTRGTVLPRYRNVSPDGRSLGQWQTDCQAAAIAAADAVLSAPGPNATHSIWSVR
jgi:hypothetical protein